MLRPIPFLVVLFACFSAWAGEPAGASDDDQPQLAFVPGKGLDIKSRTGDFRLKTKVFAQILYRATENTGEEDWLQSLGIRRARVIFSGNAYGAHNKFFIQLALSPQDLQFENGAATKSPVFDWYFRFDQLRDLTFQIGQYRVPFSKQRRIPIAKLQFIDRTVSNFEFNLDRDIGLDFRSADFLGLDLIRYHAGIFVGEGRDGYAQSDFGLLYAARIEFHPLGLFEDYVEADLRRRRRPSLALGAAYAFVDNAKRNRAIIGDIPTDGGTVDVHTATADIMLKVIGVSIFSEFYIRKVYRKYGDVLATDEEGELLVDGDGSPFVDLEAPRDGLGWFAQLGWLVPEVPLEIAGRYGQVQPLGSGSSLVRRDELGVSVNWYFFGPSMALGADYHHRFDHGEVSQGQDEFRARFQAGF